MPAIPGPDEWPLWLDPMVTDAGLLSHLLHPAEDLLLVVRRGVAAGQQRE